MEVLHRLGCSQMQGFLFSKALPPSQLEHWLMNTVLPRKAAWIAEANTKVIETNPLLALDVTRPHGGILR
jgi:hypothetical protein